MSRETGPEDLRREMLDIAVAVNEAGSVEEILDLVMRRVEELVPHDRASIALVSEEGTDLEVREIALGSGASTIALERGKRIPLREDNVLGWVGTNRRTRMRDSRDDQGFESQQEGEEVVSQIVTPVEGRDELVGVLAIGSYDEDGFDPDDRTLIERYARLIGVAISNLRSFERVRDLAIVDGLTGAYNHRHFQDVLRKEIGRSTRHETDLSLLMIDIDDFKGFNDRYGHPVGDRVLRRTVNVVRERLRESDTVFRYGGEEFAVLLPMTDREGSIRLARSLHEWVEQENVYRPSRSVVEAVTVSIGVATAPHDATRREGLVACADQALYRAKALGRNRAVAFSEIDDVRRARRELADGITPADAFESRGFDRIREHGRRVRDLVDLLASELDLEPEEKVSLRIAATYHDIGELGIPREILDKEGPLEPWERDMVRTHPAVGEVILERGLDIDSILTAILHHHEKYDGTGYPEGLAGRAIPLEARILAVAETFDALVTPRPYQDPVDEDRAYEILHEIAGYQLDPDLVHRFVAAHRRARALDEAEQRGAPST